MAKRLSAVDVLIVCGLLFTMAVGVGAFFSGLHVGRTQTESRYRELILELTSDQKARKEV